MSTAVWQRFDFGTQIIVIKQWHIRKLWLPGNFRFLRPLSANIQALEALMSDIADRVKILLWNIWASMIRLEARFIDDLGADSLDTVELVMHWKKSWC